MSYESFRLLHCHAPRLDAQIEDVADVPAAHCHLLEDATLNAFDNAITAAIEHHVDLVLITGSLFADDKPTLRGLVRLRDALSCLAEEEIVVYLTCDEQIQRLLQNSVWIGQGDVRFLSPFQKQPIALERDNRPLASICFQQPQLDDRTYRFDPPQGVYDRQPHVKVSNSSLFSIGIRTGYTGEPVEISGDYRPDLMLLCGEEFELTPAGNDVHEIFTGPLQGTTRRHTGVFGCSLIVVNEHKDVRHSFIACQAVQREHSLIHQTTDMDQAALLEAMQQHLDKLKVSSSTSVLICEWNLEGYDEHHQSPKSSKRYRWSEQSTVQNRYHHSSTTPFPFHKLTNPTRIPSIHHRFSASDELRLPSLLEHHQLAQEYLKLAEEFFPEEIDAFSEHLQKWSSGLPPELATRMQNVDRDKLIEFAVNYGTHWFVQAAEEVSA